MKDKDWCDTCKEPWASERCNTCKYGYGRENNYKPMTNADRTRSMTDEELANALASAETGVNTYGDDVYSHWLSWLKAPVEVDNG